MEYYGVQEETSKTNVVYEFLGLLLGHIAGLWTVNSTPEVSLLNVRLSSGRSAVRQEQRTLRGL